MSTASFGPFTNVRVSNTFIDVVDSDEDDRPAMAAMKSAPVPPSPISPAMSPAEASRCALAQLTPGGPSSRSPAARISPRSRLLAAVPEEPFQPFAESCRRASIHQAAVGATASLQPPVSSTRLLGREHLVLRHVANIKVKNTFIDVASDDENDGPQIEKMKSEPVKPTPLSPNGEVCAGQSRQASWQPSVMASPQEEDELRDIEHAPLDPSAAPVQENELSKPVIAPLPLRQPELSQGSAFHSSGQCKPCAWFWRPQGCFNSVDCAHCHLCLPGELKKLKKAKQQALRGRGQEHTAPTGKTRMTGAMVSSANAPPAVKCLKVRIPAQTTLLAATTSHSLSNQ
eukprot:TRINITY_DN7221_c0_g1_i3.p1 TRINITY_DN7221_c0_g1~~TRINITY_DN7221_c0_g1_i3.p1  ORF type:complete len:343 (-),score=52.10 TRINITY_DN7221_c0_g1_i3:80-1108(-)